MPTVGLGPLNRLRLECAGLVGVRHGRVRFIVALQLFRLVNALAIRPPGLALLSVILALDFGSKRITGLLSLGWTSG